MKKINYYFVEKLKIVEKQLCKLNCFYGKVSYALNKIKPKENNSNKYCIVFTMGFIKKILTTR